MRSLLRKNVVSQGAAIARVAFIVIYRLSKLNSNDNIVLFYHGSSIVLYNNIHVLYNVLYNILYILLYNYTLTWCCSEQRYGTGTWKKDCIEYKEDM